MILNYLQCKLVKNNYFYLLLKSVASAKITYIFRFPL